MQQIEQLVSDTNQMVKNAVAKGLGHFPKYLPSWLFYDAAGDLIFQEIMGLPEYYLTACESEIIETHKHEWLTLFQSSNEPFELIEFGAGDGTKTEILLRHFMEQRSIFQYRPVDISGHVLSGLTKRLQVGLPNIDIRPIVGRYEEMASLVVSSRRKIYLFMGANIGNFEWDDAISFVQSVADQMRPDDLFLVGFDMQKDKEIIRAAYDDKTGVTAQFNLNLLRRLNREINADFDLTQFYHKATYSEATGEARSYLVSKCSHIVSLEGIEETFYFDDGEMINTEISLKYSTSMIEKLAKSAGLSIVGRYCDRQNFFCDVLFTVE